jgi:hypothetical protein
MNDLFKRSSIHSALWRPAWYGLDNSLKVGQTGQFTFCHPSYRKPPADHPAELFFWSGLISDAFSINEWYVDKENFEKARKTWISHPGAYIGKTNGGTYWRQAFNRSVILEFDCTILSIHIPELGPIQEISTGDIYTFKLENGEDIEVDSETGPFKVGPLEEPALEFTVIFRFLQESEVPRYFKGCWDQIQKAQKELSAGPAH